MNNLSANPPKGPVVFAGDWHGNTNWANGCLTHLASRGVDTVLHLGDFGIWPGAGGKDYLDSMEKVAARAGIRVLFIDGNHEDFEQIGMVQRDDDGLGVFREHILHLPRGFRWEWGGVRFGALGGATSVDKAGRVPGRSWWPEEEITWRDAERFVEGGPVDVVLTHDIPVGVTVPGITRERGVASYGHDAIDAAERHQELLARALAPTRPRLIVHGHMHRRHTSVWRYEGWVARVEGLDCDGTTRKDNLLVLPLSGLGF